MLSMSERIRFQPDFYKKYVSGQPDRVADLLDIRPPGWSRQKELRSIFPEATKDEISSAIDGNKPEITIQPEELPTTVEEVSRRTGLSPTQVIQILASRSDLSLQMPELDRLTKYPVSAASEFGLNPKRIIKQARYQSRAPGGGPVQKSRLDENKASNIIREEAIKKAKITLGTSPAGLKETVSNSKKSDYEETRTEVVAEVINWFREQGSRKDWVLGRQGDLLAQRFDQLANGDRIDFLIWNCIGFQWEQDRPGGVPKCNLVSNRSESLAVYYKTKIAEISKQLVKLGQATITVLVPSNEAFNAGYDRLGVYKQDTEARNQLLDQTVNELKADLADTSLSNGITLTVKRWDKYIKDNGVGVPQEQLSEAGIDFMKASPQAKNIWPEMISSGLKKFRSKNLVVNDAIAEKVNTPYYGMYVGEGLVLKDQPVIVLNFEEMRVSQLEFLGASGNLAIVTPIKPKEMSAFYQWKNGLIVKRYSQKS